MTHEYRVLSDLSSQKLSDVNRCKKRIGLLRIFVYGQFAQLFFRLFSKWWFGIQRGRKFANFQVTLSFGISVGESCNSEDKTYQHTSPLCNSKINHDEGFYTRFALHQICLIFILILKETNKIFQASLKIQIKS